MSVTLRKCVDFLNNSYFFHTFAVSKTIYTYI